MHILFVTDNFVPEANAPAIRTFEHARRWREMGHRVTVVTGVPNFPTGRPQPPYRNRLFQRETIDGIEVRRVWTYLAPNKGVLRRSLDFLSFAISGFFGGLGVPADVIVATSPQLLTGLAGKWLARAKGKPWVFEVRDLWPDSILAVGAMRNNIEIRMLRRLERSFYKSANRIVTVSNALSARIAAGGVPESKLAVVTNGVDPSRFERRERSPELMKALGLEGKFVVAYVGSLGAAHSLDTALDATSLLKQGAVHFLFVGEGARYGELKARAAAMDLKNVTFTGMVPGGVVPDYLALADVALVSLRRTPLFRAAIPSKIFEAAAMEKPILLAVEGVAADLIADYEAGVAVPPEDAHAMAAAIETLRDDPGLRARLAAGCKRLAHDYDRRMLAEKMLGEIAGVLTTGDGDRARST
jgi:glycosyltransferase involved in cell wall biosynthesis